jgi:ribose transport system substrate-binding protein
MAPRPVLRRRPLLAGLLACGLSPARAETQRFRIALANLDETPGVTLDGLGFTGAELRRSFELAARSLPVDMVYFDNAGDPARAVANAEAAIAAHVVSQGLDRNIHGAPSRLPEARTASGTAS